MTLKILVSSLLPLIPQLVSSLLSKQSELENTMLTSRLKNSLSLLEWKYAPVNLPMGVFPKFIIVNTKPPKDLEPDQIKAIDYETMVIVSQKDLKRK